MTIAQVSKAYDISPDTLRYYERVGLIPPVHRTAGGIRDYDEVDCNWIAFAKCMRGAGIQVDALVRYVELFQVGDDTQEERKRILVQQRDQLLDRMAKMQETLERLEQKIQRYEQLIVPAERELKRLGERETPARKG